MRCLPYRALGTAALAFSASVRAAPAAAPAGAHSQSAPVTPAPSQSAAPAPAPSAPALPAPGPVPSTTSTPTAAPPVSEEEEAPAEPRGAPEAAPPAPPEQAQPAPKRSRSDTTAALGDLEESDEQEEVPPVIPPAADMRSGHFVGAIGGAFLFPVGRVEQDASLGDLTVGPAFMLDLGFGISRTTVLAVAGQYGLPGRGDACANCDPSTWAVGPFLRYHLVQGLRFDPWMAAGIGVRGVHFDSSRSYVAIDWVKLQVGGDWYPWSSIGFGPFAEFDFGSAIKASEGDLQNTALIVHTLLGIRAVLDVPGK